MNEAERLYEVIKHGDDVHRAWLKEALQCFYEGKPVPGPRSAPSKGCDNCNWLTIERNQWKDVAEDLAYELDSVITDIEAQPYVRVVVKPSYLAARKRYDDLRHALPSDGM